MNVVLGISGGIAAYKTPELVRRLRERGAEVQIVMTASAEEFVTETALQAVSGKPIRSNLWDKEAEASMSHIELARWADVVLIAPATAEMIARLASGSAPDLLSTLCLATAAPVVVAPAMNQQMWSNPAVQANRETLHQRGVHIVGPASGSQACGEVGAGRMTEPADIAAAVFDLVGATQPGVLDGKTVLLTAGPTREAIDPVRYISNRSSGKMGYALASAAAAAGADVVLVSGPVALDPPAGVRTVFVETAEQMYAAVHDEVANTDVFIAVAAVADYRPVDIADKKMKKSSSQRTIELEPTKDILASVAALDAPPFTVGFAAETNDVADYARQKLVAKRLNMIVANKVGEQQGFDSDDNAVEIILADDSVSLPRAAKTDLAFTLIEHIAAQYHAAHGAK